MNILNINTKRIFVMIVLFVLTIAILSPNTAFASDTFWSDFDIEVNDNGTDISGTTTTGTQGLAGLLEKYKAIIVGVGGIAAVTMVGIFIFHLVRLGQSAGNPKARGDALTGIMWTGVATAGLGAVVLITALFYGSIK